MTQSTERTYQNAATTPSNTMPMACARTAITQKEEQRKHTSVNMETGSYMQKGFARTATSVCTINKREEPRERSSKINNNKHA